MPRITGELTISSSKKIIADGRYIRGGRFVISGLSEVDGFSSDQLVKGAEAFNQSDGKVYRYSGSAWEKVTINTDDITSGTLGLARGGTGYTTARGVQYMIGNDIEDTSSTAITDEATLVFRRGTPTEADGAFTKKRATALYDYIKSKTDDLYLGVNKLQDGSITAINVGIEPGIKITSLGISSTAMSWTGASCTCNSDELKITDSAGSNGAIYAAGKSLTINYTGITIKNRDSESAGGFGTSESHVIPWSKLIYTTIFSLYSTSSNTYIYGVIPGYKITSIAALYEFFINKAITDGVNYRYPVSGVSISGSNLLNVVSMCANPNTTNNFVLKVGYGTTVTDTSIAGDNYNYAYQIIG